MHPRNCLFWLVSLPLWACSSNVSIRAENASSTSVAALVHRMPFLDPLLSGGQARPARALPGKGFSVEGEAPAGDRQLPGLAGFRLASGALRAETGAEASGAMTLDAGGTKIAVRRKGASRSEGRVERGAVLYEGAFAGGDALVVSRGEGVEELVVTRHPEEEFVYEVDLPAGWRLQEHHGLGLVEVRDGRDSSRLRVWANKAWDSRGNEVPVEVAAVGREVRLRARGAAVIDPYFVGVGSMVQKRFFPVTVRLPSGKVLLLDSNRTDAELYDPESQTFSLLASQMSMPRLSLRAVLMQNGRVFLSGGFTTKAEVFDPVSETFSTLPAKKSMFGYHTATLLQDGKILIVGSASSQKEADLFDPVSETFSKLESKLTHGRTLPATMLLPDGKVLLVGGEPPQEDPSYDGDHPELFDPVTLQFSRLSARLTPRDGLTATLLQDGRVLLAGGSTALQGTSQSLVKPLRDLDIYDPITQTLTPAPGLVTPRSWHTATTLQDGKIFFTGGDAADGFQKQTSTDTAEIYDPVSGVSTLSPVTMTQKRSGHTATALAGGKVLLVGGNLSASAELYDPTPDATISLFATKLATRRVGHTALRRPDGAVWLVGGTSAKQTRATASIEVYDPGSKLFSPTSFRLNQARGNHTTTVLPGGKVLLAGGWDGSRSLDSVELFDPLSGSSELLPARMVEARTFHTATPLPDGRILLAGGSKDDGPTDTAELYDPASQTFSVASKMTSRRSSHAAVLLSDGKVLITGGVISPESGDNTDTAELYDPVSNSFTSLPTMTRDRAEHSATLLPDSKVLLAFGFGTGVSLEIYDPVQQLFAPSQVFDVPLPFFAQYTPTPLANGDLLFANFSQLRVYRPGTDAFEVNLDTGLPLRAGNTTTLLLDGNVLLAGGQPFQVLNDTSPYLPLEDVAALCDGTQIEQLRQGDARPGLALTELLDGRALLTGAGKAPASPTFLSLSGLEPSSLPAVDRSYHTASLMDDGSLLLVGGVVGDAPSASVVLQALDGTRKELAPLKEARAHHTTTRLPDGRWLVAGGEAKNGALGTYEVLAADGSPSQGPFDLLSPRARHAAALLSDGRVVLVGGVNSTELLSLAEAIDPRLAPQPGNPQGLGEARVGENATVAFAGESSIFFSGSLKSVRYDVPTNQFLDPELDAGARLLTLASDQVLGCSEDCFVMSKASERRSAAVRGWWLHSDDRARALGTSGLLFAGSRENGPWAGWGTTLQPGTQQPALTTAPLAPRRSGESMEIEGSGWAALASPPAPSLDAPQALAWKPLDGVGPVHVLEVEAWKENAVSFRLPLTAYTGPGWLYAVVNGVPSEGRLLLLQQTTQGKACEEDVHCTTGFCVDKVCCNAACSDACLGCSAATKGSGDDGVCASIQKGGAPRLGGCAPTSAECGPKSGLCGGNGACEVPENIPCTEVPNGRCQGGLCLQNPPTTCDETFENAVAADGQKFSCKQLGYQCDPSTGNCKNRCDTDADCDKDAECIDRRCLASCNGDGTGLLSLDGKSDTSCGEYRCREAACLTSCTSHADCAPGARCESDGKCRKASLTAAGTDPGACSFTPRASSSLLPALLAAALSLAARRRLRGSGRTDLP